MARKVKLPNAPTGRLKHAYTTISIMSDKIDELKAEIERLKKKEVTEVNK